MKKRRISVFWCIYALLLITGIVVVQILMGYLTDFLARYEASQPKHAAEKVFSENFADFDAYKYLENFDDEIFGIETRENVAAYLEEKTSGKEFSYYSVSSKEEGTYKYSVKAGDIKIASFSLLEEKNEGERFSSYEAGDYEVYFAANESVTVTVPKGATLYLNGTPAVVENIIEDNIPHERNEYLTDTAEPVFYTKYKVEGFVAEPEIRVVLGEAELECIKGDEGFETLPVYNDELKALYGDTVLTAIENYACYMQGKYSVGGVSLGNVIKYFDPNSSLYKSIRTVANIYVNSYDSYEFKDESVSEFMSYGEDCFSCRVSFKQVLHLKGAEDYVDSIDYTLYLRRVGNSFLIYEMIHE